MATGWCGLVRLPPDRADEQREELVLAGAAGPGVGVEGRRDTGPAPGECSAAPGVPQAAARVDRSGRNRGVVPDAAKGLRSSRIVTPGTLLRWHRRGRVTCRRSTATSCRSTRTSASFAASPKRPLLPALYTNITGAGQAVLHKHQPRAYRYLRDRKMRCRSSSRTVASDKCRISIARSVAVTLITV